MPWSWPTKDEFYEIGAGDTEAQILRGEGIYWGYDGHPDNDIPTIKTSSKLKESTMLCGICRERNALSIRFGNTPYCEDCWNKESALQAANNTPEKVAERLAFAKANREPTPIENSAIKMAAAIDASVTISSDIFNLKTQDILTLKAEIDADESISNKPYYLAETLKNRFDHFTAVIFELDEKKMDAVNTQRAIQVYLNEMANTLRAEERETLKINDINYKPQPVKQIKIKAVKTEKTKKIPAHRQKIDKEALRKYAAELGISDFIIQSIVLQKGVTVEKAADLIRESIAAAKANS
jgi:hypothetical protein